MEPGQLITFDTKNKVFSKRTYWDVADYYEKPKLKIDFTEALHQTETLLKSACNYRTVADVPIGVFLSGGYDSTLVTSLLQSESSSKINTFTIGVQRKRIKRSRIRKNNCETFRYESSRNLLW